MEKSKGNCSFADRIRKEKFAALIIKCQARVAGITFLY